MKLIEQDFVILLIIVRITGFIYTALFVKECTFSG